MAIEKSCKTCYHQYHNRHTNTMCRHTLMCHDHGKWIPCTNGDYIRQMDDKGLSRFLCNISCKGNDGCYNCIAMGNCYMSTNGFAEWIGLPIDETVFPVEDS